jgi:type IV pilus assembly protein PilN
MARINLLPWREELRNRKKKEFFTLIGVSAGVALAVMLGVHVGYASSIENQKARNTYLEEQIKIIEAKIEKIKTLEKERDRLVQRMKAIEKLQTARPLVVHLFDELVSSLPEGVYINTFTQAGSVVNVSGRARSNARVSNFMRNIEASDFLENAVLDVVQNATLKGKTEKDFTLHFAQTLPKVEEVDAGKKKPDAKPAAGAAAAPAAPPATAPVKK